MSRRRAHRVPEEVMKPGDRVRTPDGIGAVVLEVSELKVVVRFDGTESFGIYAPAALTPDVPAVEPVEEEQDG